MDLWDLSKDRSFSEYIFNCFEGFSGVWDIMLLISVDINYFDRIKIGEIDSPRKFDSTIQNRFANNKKRF